MAIIRLECDMKNDVELLKLKKRLERNNMKMILSVDLNNFIDIFNNYLIETLDIDLFGYETILINQTLQNITIDLTYMRDELDEEYKYIINELKNHFGKNTINIIENEESMILNINIKTALRIMYIEADEREQLNENTIIIKIDLNSIKEDCIKKYFL